MKPIEGYNKLRGGYYTPDKISEFITDWAVKTAADTILEPSCGDGSFLNAITHRLKILGATRQEVKKNVIGVELDSVEAEKAAQYGTTVVCKDFFSYFREVVDDKKKFDAIVGNPPFIRYQNFNEEYREIAFTLMFNLLTDTDKKKYVHFRVNQIISKYKEFVSEDIPDGLHDRVVCEVDVSKYKNMRDLNKKIKDTFVKLIGA